MGNTFLYSHILDYLFKIFIFLSINKYIEIVMNIMKYKI